MTTEFRDRRISRAEAKAEANLRELVKVRADLENANEEIARMKTAQGYLEQQRATLMAAVDQQDREIRMLRRKMETSEGKHAKALASARRDFETAMKKMQEETADLLRIEKQRCASQITVAETATARYLKLVRTIRNLIDAMPQSRGAEGALGSERAPSGPPSGDSGDST